MRSEPAAGEELQRADVAEWLTALRPQLLRYCRSLCGNAWEAEDLAQDTWMKLAGLIGRDGGRTFNKAYVWRAARHLWVDRCRARQRAPSSGEPGDSPQLLAFGAADPTSTRELLESLAGRLLPKPFVILLLADVFRFTLKETAAFLGDSEGAVQVSLSRARSRLRQLASRGEPEAAMPLPAGAGRRAGADAALLEAAVEAFRRHEPRLIYDAYLKLYESGTHLASVRILAGRLHFTFRDPDGNAVMAAT
ncbi:RNA polymerase sigma factor [Cohnella nanjingensis]|uniref:RNA polymerase sigma factor n=1 Tax=Cohnella nanjingensis TaxID=1387779 RepID=A0A7X0VF16_9BACL|nr:RNA polymerase sigma factor [Cohnella nanjingensis]MBB6671590.1 RNA polymerase sigma factor [Cohnella nanjingensis]